jgi:hypothetical protein
MTVTAYLKHADFRHVMDAWISLCDCEGPQPSPEDFKLEQHREDCPFKIRVESQQHPQEKG